jgi:hypothetical protein
MDSTASKSALSLGMPGGDGIIDRTRGAGVAAAGPATPWAPAVLAGGWAKPASGAIEPTAKMTTAVHGHACRFLIPSPPRNAILAQRRYRAPRCERS